MFCFNFVIGIVNLSYFLLMLLPLLKVAKEFVDSIYDKKPEKFKVIVSSHNYQETPSAEALGNLVATIQATGADIVKIATTALDITDVARIFQITVHSQVSNVGGMLLHCTI